VSFPRSTAARPLLAPDRVEALLRTLEDEAIVRRVRAGETELYELLVRRHNQRLYRTARAVLRDEDEAEDVVQEAYVAAFVHLDRFQGRSAFSTWITRIALHAALARRRRARRQEPVEPALLEEIPTMSDTNPASQVESRELGALLTEAVERLSGSLRLVYVLREVEGLSVEETARVLEITPENVKVRLHRARRALRQDLGRRMDAERSRIYPFHLDRCDRIVAAVFRRIAGGGPFPPVSSIMEG
jgi:RNA polymerase sigma-70 factor (ECF subfamily)